MKTWLAICIVVIMGIVSGHAYAVSDQILLETNLTELAQNALNNMYGKGNFIIRIRVAMTESKYEVNYTKQSNPKLRKSKRKEKRVYILPGVPALKNIAPDALNRLPYDSVTKMVNPKVKKILVYIIVNKTFSKRKVREAERMLKELLDLKDNRDKIRVTYKRFEVNANEGTQQITMVPGKEKLMSYQNLFYLLVIIFSLLGLITYIIFQRKQNRLNSNKSNDGEPGVSVNPHIEVTGGGGNGGSKSSQVSLSKSGSMKYYFEFIHDGNIEDFIFLLKNETINPEYLAIILSYVEPHLSAQILAELEIEIKTKVTEHLLNQRLGNKELIERLESKLKSALECFVGGDKKTQDILDKINGAEKKELLTQLEATNQSVYQKVRQMVVLFEDLQLLSDDEIQLIVSDINLDQLAAALVSIDQPLYQHFYTNLAESAKGMLQQYLDLKKENITQKEIQDAQEAILKHVKSLASQGKIELKEGE
jgi:hypothetical protein